MYLWPLRIALCHQVPRFIDLISTNDSACITNCTYVKFTSVKQINKLYNSEKVVIFIDRIAGAIIRLVASVCPSVCLWVLSCLNYLTLIFGMRVDLDLG